MWPFGGLLLPGRPLEVTANNVGGSDQGFQQCGIVGTSGTNVVVSNGSGNYTYLWIQTGTPAERGPYGINNTITKNPIWQEFVCDPDAPSAENWTLTVTDTTTSQTAQVTISVSLTFINLN